MLNQNKITKTKKIFFRIYPIRHKHLLLNVLITEKQTKTIKSN